MQLGKGQMVYGRPRGNIRVPAWTATELANLRRPQPHRFRSRKGLDKRTLRTEEIRGDTEADNTEAKQSNKMSVENEQEALEWFRDHPELYAKKSAKYLDTAYKTRVIRKKAEEMGIHGESLSPPPLILVKRYLRRMFINNAYVESESEL